jgi:hypothetical protein
MSDHEQSNIRLMTLFWCDCGLTTEGAYESPLSFPFTARSDNLEQKSDRTMKKTEPGVCLYDINSISTTVVQRTASFPCCYVRIGELKLK